MRHLRGFNNPITVVEGKKYPPRPLPSSAPAAVVMLDWGSSAWPSLPGKNPPAELAGGRRVGRKLIAAP